MNAPVDTLPAGVSAPSRRSLPARLAGVLVPLAVGIGLAAAGYLTRERWLPVVMPTSASVEAEPHDHDHDGAAEAPNEQITLSEQARKNLNLTAKPLKAQTFWKTRSVPGIVIDSPGHSDRGIVAPVTGIVSRIHHFAGDSVQPGEVLFTIKLLSESLFLTQTDLFKASQDVKLAQVQRQRLVGLSGAVPESRLVDVESQITRLGVGIRAYRQELLNRGISAEQIEAVAEGKFVSEMPIVLPIRAKDTASPLVSKRSPGEAAPAADSYELQELKVELGQQVQAGQTLCLVSNHRVLAIEGRAFRDETSFLERSVREGWPVEVDFADDDSRDWPATGQEFRVRSIANTIDPDTRTFRFLMPLENQSRVIERDGRSQLLWQYRPGQRVRARLRVEAVENVFVLPTEAVAREGAQAFVFRQNGDDFERRPVHVVFLDSQQVVIANDGSVAPGVYVARTGAAQMNRMVKSQTGTTPKGFHIHADGSVHMGNH